MGTEQVNEPQPAAPRVEYTPLVRVVRALALAFSTGMLSLFVTRDLIQASGSVYTVAVAIGALCGVVLELAADSVRNDAG